MSNLVNQILREVPVVGDQVIYFKNDKLYKGTVTYISAYGFSVKRDYSYLVCDAYFYLRDYNKLVFPYIPSGTKFGYFTIISQTVDKIRYKTTNFVHELSHVELRYYIKNLVSRKFYMVKGEGPTKHIHQTLEAANAEAKRLSEKVPDQNFYVLKVVNAMRNGKEFKTF